MSLLMFFVDINHTVSANRIFTKKIFLFVHTVVAQTYTIDFHHQLATMCNQHESSTFHWLCQC